MSGSRAFKPPALPEVMTEHPASLPALVIGMIFIPLVWSISLVTKGVQFVYGIALPRAVAIVLGTLTVLAAPLASSWVTGEGRYVAMGIAYTFLPAALVLVTQASLQFKELRQARSRLIEEMGKELKTAREMQSRLMPIEHPSGESFGIAGRCSLDQVDVVEVIEMHHRLSWWRLLPVLW